MDRVFKVGMVDGEVLAHGFGGNTNQTNKVYQFLDLLFCEARPDNLRKNVNGVSGGERCYLPNVIFGRARINNCFRVIGKRLPVR